MKKVLVFILSTASLLAGCGTNEISENAKVVNDYTQSNIGTYLERLGCKLTPHERNGELLKINVNHCSTISNEDAITFIKENIVDRNGGGNRLVNFKSGK